MSGDGKRSMRTPMSGRGRAAQDRISEGGAVADRLAAIEARLAVLTPEPVVDAEAFLAGQLELAKSLRDSLDEQIAGLEAQIAEMAKGQGS